MTEWTPGPWFADTWPGWDAHSQWPRYRVVALMGDPREGKYLMNVMYPEDDNEQPYDAQAVANAHLMAAAPTLYDALAALYEANDRGVSPVDLGDALAYARIALAKARGEQEES